MVPTTLLKSLPVGIARVAARFGERGVEVGDAASLRAGHVVGHDVDPVEDLSGLAQLEAGDWNLTAGRNRRRQQVALARGRAKRVELAAKLLEEERAVSPILRSIGVLRQTATDGILPVDVDAVEDARPASQEELDARGDEIARRFSSVATASEKRPEPVQPPIEIIVFR